MVIADLTAQVEQANSGAQDAKNATQSITGSIEELKMSVDRTYLFSLIGGRNGRRGYCDWSRGPITQR